MWSNSKHLIARTLLATFCFLSGSPGAAVAEELPVTAQHEKICARAEARYQKLFPDVAKEDGVVIVKLYKYTFCPRNVAVRPGTTVRWVNVDKRTSHSVWLKQAGEAESERFFPDEQWEFQFISPGKYPYLCGPHWDQEDMRGFVEVLE